MIHTPCNRDDTETYDPLDSHPCHGEDGKCTKGFPYRLRDETLLKDNSYAQTRRRSELHGGNVIRWKKKGADGQWCSVDNGYVIRYNPKILLKYECHANLEMCQGLASLKYVCGYMTKGYDMACFRLLKEKYKDDEIGFFENGRFIGAHEALWHLWSFPMFTNKPAVVALDVHLPNNQSIYWNRNWQEMPEEALAHRKRTKLTAWFELNADPVERLKFPAPQDILYQDVPKFFTWDKKERRWKRKDRNIMTVGRMHLCNFRNAPRWALRKLLLRLSGPRSWWELCMVPKDEDINFMLEEILEEGPQDEEDDSDGFIESDSDVWVGDEAYVPDESAEEKEDSYSADVESSVDAMDVDEDEDAVAVGDDQPNMTLRPLKRRRSDDEDGEDMKPPPRKKRRKSDKWEIDATSSEEEEERSIPPQDTTESTEEPTNDMADEASPVPPRRPSVPDWNETELSDGEDEGFHHYPEQPQHFKVRTDLKPDEYTVYDTPLVCV